MLDKQDLQAIQEMITASEERTQAKLDRLAPTDRIHKLEEDVALLKYVVNTLTVRISELEKAR